MHGFDPQSYKSLYAMNVEAYPRKLLGRNICLPGCVRFAFYLFILFGTKGDREGLRVLSSTRDKAMITACSRKVQRHQM